MAVNCPQILLKNTQFSTANCPGALLKLSCFVVTNMENVATSRVNIKWFHTFQILTHHFKRWSFFSPSCQSITILPS